VALFDRTPLVSAEAAIYGPRRAAAMLHPAEGRWPGHEPADRLALGIGTAALGAYQSSDDRWTAYREALTRASTGIVEAGAEPLPGGLVVLDGLGVPGELAVVPWQGPGQATFRVDLLESRVGLVPRIAEASQAAGPVKEIGALTLVIALAVDADAEGRLELALGIEGVVSWFRDSDRRAPPRNALAFAIAHARGRLAETGGSLPPGL
jgi:hypothetical protein